MTYEVGSVRKFKVADSFQAEGRLFYDTEVYEAHYKEGWEEDQLSVEFHAENGYFNFTDELFERVIVGWELVEITD